MNRIILLLFVIFSPVLAEAACKETYFASINVKEIPQRPFNKISEEVAGEREKVGEHYYIKRTCRDGALVSIIHRQDRMNLAKSEYFYQDTHLVKYIMTNTQGETFEYDL